MKTAPTTYAIRVDGHLGDHWSAWLGDLDMTQDNDGTTTITASIADQAQLHGIAAGLRDIGATGSDRVGANRKPHGALTTEVSNARRTG